MLVCTFRFPKKGRSLVMLAGFVLIGPPALAQSPNVGPQPAPLSAPSAPSQPTYGQALQYPPLPDQVPRVAQTPQSPQRSASDIIDGVTAPGSTDYTTPGAAAGAASDFGGFGSAFASGAGGAGMGATTAIASNGGYIDSAIIRSRVRVRFDANYDDTSPDKAEFIYPQCGCFSNPLNFLSKVENGQRVSVPRGTPGAMFNATFAFQHGYNPMANGPQHGMIPHVSASSFPAQPRINYQEVATYLEYAPTQNFSGFIELPARFIQNTIGPGASGFSDLNLGFKYALVAEPNRYYTFQYRTYCPTGAPNLGLGTGHVSLEPALLVFQRLTERLYFDGEFRDWIPVGGTNFAGNVLRYGVGLTYNFVLTDRFRIAPVNEIVGWTILNGKEFIDTASMPLNVAGQTIVNEKIGIRIGLGNYNQAGGGSPLNDRHSLYVGYGRCITGGAWYRDTFRLEYNFWF